MAIAEPWTSVERVRAELQSIPPPYLFRKYEAAEEDYEALAEENLRCEYLDGVLIVHSPATIQHEERISFLHVLLGHFVNERKLGRLFGSNAVMQLESRRLCPDLSYLATGNLGRIKGGRVHGPMDLVIEVVSSSTRDYDLGEKRAAYRDGLVPEIWMFDPDGRSAIVDCVEAGQYRSQALSTGRIASRVLPGLNIYVDWLWSDPLPNPLDCLRLATT